MTAAEIIAQVREYGGDMKLLPDGQRLAIEHRSLIPDALIQAVKLHADELRALLTTQTKSTTTNAALEAQKLLRQGRWPTMTPEECGFHIGAPGATCRRCGAPWVEHYALREMR